MTEETEGDRKALCIKKCEKEFEMDRNEQRFSAVLLTCDSELPNWFIIMLVSAWKERRSYLLSGRTKESWERKKNIFLEENGRSGGSQNRLTFTGLLMH